MAEKMEINLKLGKVGKLLVEKIAGAIGILYDSHGFKEGDRTFSKMMVEKIMQDESLSVEEKAFVWNEYKYNITKNKNRKDILEKAQPHLTESANPNEMSDDWILDYWEKIGKIVMEEFQELWARLLAEEANYPGTVSKRLLHNMFLMSKQDVENFMNLTRFCFFDKKEDMIHPIIFIKEDSVAYKRTRVTTEVLRELEQFSLIEVDYTTGFSFHNKKDLMYTNHYIELKASRIFVGNVRLTADGQKLFKIVDKRNNDQILSYTIQKLQYHGCDVKVISK